MTSQIPFSASDTALSAEQTGSWTSSLGACERAVSLPRSKKVARVSTNPPMASFNELRGMLSPCKSQRAGPTLLEIRKTIRPLLEPGIENPLCLIPAHSWYQSRLQAYS